MGMIIILDLFNESADRKVLRDWRVPDKSGAQVRSIPGLYTPIEP